MLQINPDQYRAFCDSQMKDFVCRLQVSVKKRFPSVADHYPARVLLDFISSAIRTGITVEQDIADLLEIVIRHGVAVLTRPDIAALLDDTGNAGDLKVYQIRWAIEGGRAGE